MEETVHRLLVAPKLQIIGFLVMVENLNLGFIPSPCYRHYNLCVNGLPSLVAFPSGCKRQIVLLGLRVISPLMQSLIGLQQQC
ncbi:hypothetical protein POPTR_004G102875v4 [Populus trichocarpa]|uniref:Uncharacterized protein n=1 Tax=Populus trichocarpa TaxID=3694 RepID=A0ACC0T3W8_POPTR|nr:hypothetical protein BDE02_04G089100 [Populus trichocarpa]KAI9396265.1 hypothetical protein POPTR_004G102875v4 [Populus trichocarpa]